MAGADRSPLLSVAQAGVEFDDGAEALLGRVGPEALALVLYVLLDDPLLPVQGDEAKVRVMQVVPADQREVRVDGPALALQDPSPPPSTSKSQRPCLGTSPGATNDRVWASNSISRPWLGWATSQNAREAHSFLWETCIR
jgi:hypothetical protein